MTNVMWPNTNRGLERIVSRLEEALMQRTVSRRQRAGRIGAASLALLLTGAGPVFLAQAFQRVAKLSDASVCGPAPALELGTLGAVAFVREDELHVVDLTTGVDRTLASGAAVTAGSASVRWSYDGR